MSLLSDLNDKIKNLSARVAEQFKTQQTIIDAKVSTVNGMQPDENGDVTVAAGGAALPLGWEYTRLVSDVAPKGGADYLGQEATREFYAGLWEYVNTEHPGRIISEDDWQAMYAAQNGNVPYYSTGDGSTTFRFPRVVSYLRAGDTAGQYTAEGLPDHDHTRGTMNITGNLRLVNDYNYDNEGVHDVITGAFSTTTPAAMGATIDQNTTPSNDGIWPVTFDASKTWTGSTSLASESDSIYGASDHVTPETITVVMGVIAFGEVRSIGTVTEAGILAEMESIKGSYVKKSGDTMTGDLVLQRESPQMRIIDTTITKGTALDAGTTKYLELIFADSTELTTNPSLTGTSRVSDANMGIVGTSVDETGLVRTYLRSYYFASGTDDNGEYTLGIVSDTANSTGYVYTTANKFQFGNGSMFWIE